MLDAGKLNFATVEAFFEKDIIDLADTYIRRIADTYRLDFQTTKTSYNLAAVLLRYLVPCRSIISILVQTRSDIARSRLLIEFEIAFSIQSLALDFYGNYLDDTELLYLAFCISGALAYKNRTSPRLKTVIMCQLNLSSSWDLKHRILSKFKDYIDLSALLPVYVKDNYDFTKVDLIITTANKEITREPNCKTLLITPFLTQADQEKLENHIVKTQINRLYNTSLPSIQELFQEAFWHEKVVADDRFSVIEMLAKDFISRGYVSGNYLADILRRESILTFAFQPSIVLMYSLEPSTKTCLSIATLDHHIKWNSTRSVP